MTEEAITAASKLAYGVGIRILQGFRFAPTDGAHVSALLKFMAPKHKTTWVDIGCGFGEVARLMYLERPDLDFVLVNNNPYQLDQAPLKFRRLLCEMSGLRLPDATLDGAMFLYSLCHAEPFTPALTEAARVVKPGGELFVFDYERIRGDNTLMRNRLNARAISHDSMARITERAGWEITQWDYPEGDDTLFRNLFATPVEYEMIFKDLVPTVWKARRV